jgi:hypothetical protein
MSLSIIDSYVAALAKLSEALALNPATDILLTRIKLHLTNSKPCAALFDCGQYLQLSSDSAKVRHPCGALATLLQHFCNTRETLL